MDLHKSPPLQRDWSIRPIALAGISLIIAGDLHAGKLPDELADWSPVVRASAVERTNKAGPEALPELIGALQSDNAGLRHSATKIIATVANRSPGRKSAEWKLVTDKLIRILKDDKDFWTRCGAASALKAIGSKSAAPALIQTAGDPNPWVAAAAVDAISTLPVEYFGKEEYLSTAVKSLAAPRSATRSSAVKMLTTLGPEGKEAMPQVEDSVASLSQDSMFADKPRIEAIIWISRFDRRKAAALANGLLLEDRWGAKTRQSKLIPVLQKLGPDAAPAKEGLQRVAEAKRDKTSSDRAAKILNNLNP